MTIKDRILKFLDYKGISVTRAESELGWSKSSLLKSNNVSSDKIGEFVRFYPDVSADWLLTGYGDRRGSSVRIAPESLSYKH